MAPLTKIVVPAITGWKPLERLRLEHERLQAERGKAAEELHRLSTAERPAAIDADTRAHAAALRSAKGANDPGPREQIKVEERIAATKRRLEALTLAVEQIEAELVQLVEQHRAERLAEQDAVIEQKRTDKLTTARAHIAAQRALAEAKAVRAWLADFPDRPAYRVVDGRFPLPGRNGELVSWATLAAALLEDCELPAPPRPPAPVQPLRRIAA